MEVEKVQDIQKLLTEFDNLCKTAAQEFEFPGSETIEIPESVRKVDRAHQELWEIIRDLDNAGMIEEAEGIKGSVNASLQKINKASDRNLDHWKRILDRK